MVAIQRQINIKLDIISAVVAVNFLSIYHAHTILSIVTTTRPVNRPSLGRLSSS